MKLPWAKRHHTHPHLERPFYSYGRCSKCGHLILLGQIDNKEVRVRDNYKFKGAEVEYTLVYAEGCAPEYNYKEIAIDGTARFYKDGKEVSDDRDRTRNG